MGTLVKIRAIQKYIALVIKATPRQNAKRIIVLLFSENVFVSLYIPLPWKLYVNR